MNFHPTTQLCEHTHASFSSSSIARNGMIFCKLILNVFREICYVSDRHYLLKMLALLYYIIVDFIKEIANQPYQINTCGITSN